MPPSPDRAAFLAAIRAEPEADGPRLVYADWLEERGEAARAEFIRLGCELARAPFGVAPPAKNRRLRELIDRHAAEWVGCYDDARCQVRFRRGFADVIRAPVEVMTPLLPVLAETEPLIHWEVLLGGIYEGAEFFRVLRSFGDLVPMPDFTPIFPDMTRVHGLIVNAESSVPIRDLERHQELVTNQFANLLTPLVQTGGIQTQQLHLLGIDFPARWAFGELGFGDYMPLLHELCARGCRFYPGTLAHIGYDQNLDLKSLQLRACHLNEAHASDLATGWTPDLHSLCLSANLSLPCPAVGKLLTAWSCLELRELRLDSNLINDAELVQLLATLASFPHLEHLSLAGRGDAHRRVGQTISTLAEVADLPAGPPNLKKLRLDHQDVNADGAANLARWAGFAKLEDLSLAGCPLGPDGAAALGSATFAPTLRLLDLTGCLIGDWGLERMAERWPADARLDTLALGTNRLTERIAAFLTRPGLWPHLRNLDLSGNPFNGVGAATLARSEMGQRLEMLVLSGEAMSGHTADAVRAEMGDRVVIL